MKKVSTLLLAFLTLLFISCEGDPGPPGPPGFDGVDGADGLIGSVFEAEVTFNAANEYQTLVTIPTSIEVFDTDVVTAYVLTDVDNGVDIWEPLPRTLFFGSEILLYGYDFTFSDVNFFLDGTVDFAGLDPIYTDGVIFRVAVIPADLASRINTSDINEVMGAMNIKSVERVR
ncbi:MAG: collagen-like protein [Flavobacteriaceae bacterium]|nr:collagen-like protein [Flavobacteriaceae bacterium]